MNDLALKILSPADLSYYHTFPNWSYPPNRMTAAFAKALAQSLSHLKHQKISRIYFGAEFCENLLPKTDTLLSVLDFCRQQALAFSFLTPLTSEHHQGKLRALLDLLADDRDFGSCEVIYNDLGTLMLLKQHYPNFTAVRGRLMQKKMYDIRLDPAEFRSQLTAVGQNAFFSSVISDEYAALISQYGVTRIETDAIGENLDKECRPDFAYSVYLPFGFYSSGHICMFKNLPLPEERQFSMDEATCGHSCTQYQQIMYKQLNHLADVAGQEIMLFRAGNTLLHLNNVVADEALLSRFRVVLQPYPMN